MTKVRVLEKSEKTVQIQALGPDQCFRLLGVTFEEACTADEGPDFYLIIGEKKDGLIEAVSMGDPKKRRKLPGDMVVAPHFYEFHIAPADKI